MKMREKRLGKTKRKNCAPVNCGRQEEPVILNSRLLLRMRRMYVASIRLDFH